MDTMIQDNFRGLSAKCREEPVLPYLKRKEVLLLLKKNLIQHEKDIIAACNQDYGYRREFDTVMADILPSVMSINYTLKHLKKWLKPVKRSAGLLFMPSKVRVHYLPLGVVGIIVPWNFPVFLALSPCIQALAAGNRVMIKLSECTPHVNEVLKTIMLPLSEYVSLVEGDASAGESFSSLPFDHLLFTGSTRVGRQVACRAAKNLTPVTLELGGKSPVIITLRANLQVAIDAIIFGKTINAGQICVAPDTIYIHQSLEQHFIEQFKRRYKALATKKITEIISDRQYHRLISMLSDAKQKGAKIYQLTEGEFSQQSFPLILITNVKDDMQVMQEEIFGPLLPIQPFEQVEEVVQCINSKPKPLACYIMSSQSSEQQYLINSIPCGGVCINDTVVHASVEDAPFGGIGESGMGEYHGIEGFKRFSKAKTVLSSPTWLNKNALVLKLPNRFLALLRLIFLR